MGLKEEYERHKANHDRRGEQKQALIGFGKRTFRHPDRIVRFTWWVAAFTCALAIVGFIQAWAFIQSERAFLAVVGLVMDGGPPQEGATIVRFFITIKNSGRSTASIDDGAINIRFGPLPKQVSYMPAPLIAFGPITPDNPNTGPAEFTLPHAINRADADAIKAGTLQFSIFGFIKYSDDFTLFRDKTMGFCFYYTPKPTGSAPYNTCVERGYTCVY